MYYALLPFAVYALVIMRKRRVPISPMIAIFAMVTSPWPWRWGSPGTGSGADVALAILGGVAIDGFRHLPAKNRQVPSRADDGLQPRLIRRARQPAQHRAPRRRAPGGALRRRALPALALRREPVRSRHPARGIDDDGVRVAHYALIPQRYRGREGVVPAAFSLHAVVRSGTQRKGYFQQIGAEIYEEATAAGWQLSTGVCNDKSIGAVTKYMGWKTPGPLPVRLCVPMHTGRGVTSAARRRRPPRQRRVRRPHRRARRLPRRPVDELLHHRVPAVAARVPEHGVRAAHQRRPRRRSPPPTHASACAPP